MERIVVGVDGSKSAEAALTSAADAADVHDAALVAVMAWSYLDQHHAGGNDAFDPSYGADDAASRAWSPHAACRSSRRSSTSAFP